MAGFESNDIIINDTMSEDEIVASDVPPRYLFRCYEGKKSVLIPEQRKRICDSVGKSPPCSLQNSSASV